MQKQSCIHTLFETQVGNFAYRGTPPLHKDKQLIQEELLFWMWEPVPIPMHLHTAHHILLQKKKKKSYNTLEDLSYNDKLIAKDLNIKARTIHNRTFCEQIKGTLPINSVSDV